MNALPAAVTEGEYRYHGEDREREGKRRKQVEPAELQNLLAAYSTAVMQFQVCGASDSHSHAFAVAASP